MSIIIQLYHSPSELVEAVNEATRAHLFVDGWYFSQYYSKVLDHARDLPRWDHEYYMNEYMIVLAWNKYVGKPVAIAAAEKSRVMAFCLEAYRRQGIASRCVQRVIARMRHRPDVNAGTGISGSDLFWTSNGVLVDNDYWP
jgi:GNAT superfamily N-acetyltransferase